ncbi:pogo transposable element with KRAB domain [Ixodes scapularis]
MKRKGFSMRRRTSICQKLPEAYEEKLVAFQRFVIMLRRTNNYIAGQMGNADQTPMFFDMPSNYTVETKGAKQVRILTSGNEKNRVTAMLCCTADGHKLNPYLIFKRKTLPANVAFPANVIVRVHPKGWMETDLMVDWIDSVWRKRPGADLAVRSMLVLDSFRCHITQRVKDKLAACRTDLVVIPGGMTSQLQPLDVCLNKPIKDRVRAACNEWLIDGEHALTPAGRLKRAALNDLAKKGFNGPQRGRFPELESALSDFVKELRTNQLPVSSDIIKVKALQLALSFRIPRTSFKASRSWITKFMKRKGFSMRRRTSICQKLPEAYEEKLVAFQRFVIMLRRTNNYIAGQMGNADQTPMFFDMPSNYTVETKGAKQVRILTSGNEKNRVTAMLCCTADGHKLNPYLIFKRKTLPANVAFPANVIVRVHPKGWMETDLMVDWIDSVWRKRPGADLAVRSMLVLDSFRCHITQRVKDKLAACRTDLVVIPGGMTSQLQPLDVCLNKPIKDRVRAACNEWLIDGEHALTPAGRLKRAALNDLANRARRQLAAEWASAMLTVGATTPPVSQPATARHFYPVIRRESRDHSFGCAPVEDDFRAP